MGTALTIDESALQDRIDFVNMMTEQHLGGVHLVSAIDGVVTVKFDGMCTGCQLRPMTLNSLIRPALSQVAGVVRVEAQGLRMSAYAEQRLGALRDDRSAPGAQYGRIAR